MIFFALLLVALGVGIRRNVRTIVDQWPWYYAKEVMATVARHDVYSADGDLGSHLHLVEYTFVANGTAFKQTISASSISPEYFELGSSLVTFELGSQFKLYYRPESPLHHRLFDDPRPAIWGQMSRVGVVTSVFLALAAVGAYVFLASRPKRRLSQDAKFEMPQNLDIPSTSSASDQ